MKNILFLTSLWLFASLPMDLNGQSIRKDYREFTAKEMTDYMNIVKQLGQFFVIAAYTYNYDQTICDNIHTTYGATCHPAQYGEYYLPWHRVLLQDFEYQLKQWSDTTAYLTVPYWDWTVDNNIGAPNFWDNTFLAEANFAPDLSITRCLGTGSCAGATLPTTADVDALLELTS
ncbi:MAG: tyrosinase family protein, partial [Phycisphaerae bacterium]|nr:tyrosinase family protein [Saprospiraceae bacterium]